MTIWLSRGRAFQTEEKTSSKAPREDAIGVFEGGGCYRKWMFWSWRKRFGDLGGAFPDHNYDILKGEMITVSVYASGRDTVCLKFWEESFMLLCRKYRCGEKMEIRRPANTLLQQSRWDTMVLQSRLVKGEMLKKIVTVLFGNNREERERHLLF